MIATGRDSCERFRADPDSPADVNDEPWEAELFGAVAGEVYDARTVRDLDDTALPVEAVEELPSLEPDGEPAGDASGWRDEASS